MSRRTDPITNRRCATVQLAGCRVGCIVTARRTVRFPVLQLLLARGTVRVALQPCAVQSVQVLIRGAALIVGETCVEILVLS